MIGSDHLFVDVLLWNTAKHILTLPNFLELELSKTALKPNEAETRATIVYILFKRLLSAWFLGRRSSVPRAVAGDFGVRRLKAASSARMASPRTGAHLGSNDSGLNRTRN